MLVFAKKSSKGRPKNYAYDAEVGPGILTEFEQRHGGPGTGKLPTSDIITTITGIILITTVILITTTIIS